MFSGYKFIHIPYPSSWLLTWGHSTHPTWVPRYEQLVFVVLRRTTYRVVQGLWAFWTGFLTKLLNCKYCNYITFLKFTLVLYFHLRVANESRFTFSAFLFLVAHLACDPFSGMASPLF